MNKRLQITINRQVSSIQITIHIHKQKDLFWAIVLHNKPLFTQGNNCSGLLRDCFPEICPLNVYSTKKVVYETGTKLLKTANHCLHLRQKLKLFKLCAI